MGETGGQILQGLPNFIELKKNRSRERSVSRHRFQYPGSVLLLALQVSDSLDYF